MGMRKDKIGVIGAVLGLGMATLSSEMHHILSEGNKIYDDATPEPEEPRHYPKPKRIEFKDEDGVKRTIKEYISIKEGTSKLNDRKKNRTLQRVQEWIEKGLIDPIEINNQP